MNQKEVGDYVNKHFVSSYQKVATFTLNNGNKQGGNVASYFCTADGHVLHIVPGPVSGTKLLEEARWIVETWKLAQMLEVKQFAQAQTLFRKAHQDRLNKEFKVAVHPQLLPALEPKSATGFISPVVFKLFKGHHHGNDIHAKVHELLTAYPLPKVGRVYRLVFENLLNEKISTVPVVQKN